MYNENLLDLVRKSRTLVIVGDRETTKEIIENLRRDVKLIRIPLHEYESPMDMILPYYDKNDEIKYSLSFPFPKEGEGIIVWEGLVDAPPSVQQIVYEAITKRELGNHQLGEKWYNILIVEGSSTNLPLLNRIPIIKR